MDSLLHAFSGGKDHFQQDLPCLLVIRRVFRALGRFHEKRRFVAAEPSDSRVFISGEVETFQCKFA